MYGILIGLDLIFIHTWQHVNEFSAIFVKEVDKLVQRDKSGRKSNVKSSKPSIEDKCTDFPRAQDKLEVRTEKRYIDLNQVPR